jgi:hypothetical protein
MTGVPIHRGGTEDKETNAEINTEKNAIQISAFFSPFPPFLRGEFHTRRNI